jgi:hypothetical protein
MSQNKGGSDISACAAIILVEMYRVHVSEEQVLDILNLYIFFFFSLHSIQ